MPNLIDVPVRFVSIIDTNVATQRMSVFQNNSHCYWESMKRDQLIERNINYSAFSTNIFIKTCCGINDTFLYWRILKNMTKDRELIKKNLWVYSRSYFYITVLRSTVKVKMLFTCNIKIRIGYVCLFMGMWYYNVNILEDTDLSSTFGAVDNICMEFVE